MEQLARKKIWNLYIPMLWEPLKMSTIMVITGVLKIFDTVYILTPTGGTSNCTIVPALLMYNEAYRYGHYGTGSAIATVIFVLSAAVSIFSFETYESERIHRILGGIDHENKKHSAGYYIGFLIFIIVALINIYPMVFSIFCSFKGNLEIFSSFTALPKKLRIENYLTAWNVGNIGRYFL